MRYLLLSDVHANLEALQAVLDHADKRGWDKILSLGDEVGYNPSPNEVMEIFCKYEDEGRLESVILGNHDKVAVGQCNAENFNERARKSALWTQEQLLPEYVKWLESLADMAFVEEDIQVVHGSPLDPDAYISHPAEARFALDNLEPNIRICFHGHTHLVMVHELVDKNMNRLIPTQDEFVLDIDKNGKYLVNPGSVGQPRDNNSKAAYGIFDSKQSRLWLYRVPYDIAAVQEKIFLAGLPEINASRLSKGW